MFFKLNVIELYVDYLLGTKLVNFMKWVLFLFNHSVISNNTWSKGSVLNKMFFDLNVLQVAHIVKIILG